MRRSLGIGILAVIRVVVLSIIVEIIHFQRLLAGRCVDQLKFCAPRDTSHQANHSVLCGAVERAVAHPFLWQSSTELHRS